MADWAGGVSAARHYNRPSNFKHGMQEDFEVEHSHARVLRQGDGSFILQSEDRATFEVLDADGGDSQKTGQVGVK